MRKRRHTVLLFLLTNIVPILIGLVVGLALGIVGTVMTHKCKPLTPTEIAEYAKKNGCRVNVQRQNGETVHYALVTEIYSDEVVFTWQEAENGQFVQREITVAKCDLDWVRL